MILWERPGFIVEQKTDAKGEPVVLFNGHPLSLDESAIMASYVIDACTAHRVA
jgi:hypothetical protein